MKRICVYCGSSPGKDESYMRVAGELGKFMADQGCDLVYGGAAIGIMGKVADAVLEGGGNVIGVVPKSLKKVSHENLSELHVVETMHERKQLMFDLSDACIALPGGIGTLEEIFEVFTWAQLGFHTKPIGVLNIAGFYDKLMDFLNFAVEQRFVKQEHREILLSDGTIEGLIGQFKSYTPPVTGKWID